MYLECSECQIVLHGENAPFICPNCGLAGVTFSQIDDETVAQHLAEGDGFPLELALDPEGVSFVQTRWGL